MNLKIEAINKESCSRLVHQFMQLNPSKFDIAQYFRKMGYLNSTIYDIYQIEKGHENKKGIWWKKKSRHLSFDEVGYITHGLYVYMNY